MILVADGHTHSNPVKGLGMERIAPKFKERGGWFMAIVGLSPWHYGLEGTLEGYEKALQITLRECEVARNFGLRTSCLFGFHPADVDKFIGKMQPHEVLEFGKKVLRLVERELREGRLNGIGEVGRQHYKTHPISVVIAEKIMDEAFRLSKEFDAVVHLHLEQGGRVSVIDIKERVERFGVNPNRIVMHHLRGKTLRYALEEGVRCTVPGVKGLLENITSLPPEYIIESDHIDDPKRPGIVVYPWEMAENQAELLKRGLVDEEYLYKINVDNVVKVFNVEPPR